MNLQNISSHFLPLIPNCETIRAHFPCVFEKTLKSFNVTCYIPLRGKQKFQVTNVGVKSKVVTFATRNSETQSKRLLIVYSRAVLTKGNYLKVIL